MLIGMLCDVITTCHVLIYYQHYVYSESSFQLVLYSVCVVQCTLIIEKGLNPRVDIGQIDHP